VKNSKIDKFSEFFFGMLKAHYHEKIENSLSPLFFELKSTNIAS